MKGLAFVGGVWNAEPRNSHQFVCPWKAWLLLAGSETQSVATHTNFIPLLLLLFLIYLPQHNLKCIPNEIFTNDSLKQLKSLDLSKNSLGSQNDAAPNVQLLGTMTLLKTLHIDSNNLTVKHLPTTMENCTKLQTFTVSDNPKLGDTDAAWALPPLPTSIKNLSAAKCRLSRFPATLLRLDAEQLLKCLQTLDLSNNSIVELPRELFAACLNLVEINLSFNSVFVVPEEVGTLKVREREKIILGKTFLDLLSPNWEETHEPLSPRIQRLKSFDLANNRIIGTDTNCLPRALFVDTPVIDITLTGNEITPSQLNDFEGFDSFLDRRTNVKRKDLAGGALTDLGVCGLWWVVKAVDKRWFFPKWNWVILFCCQGGNLKKNT